jgi:hypothetical protein
VTKLVANSLYVLVYLCVYCLGDLYICLTGTAVWSDIRCIATDGCGAFDAVLRETLPGVDHLRCRFHIFVNISKNLRKRLSTAEWAPFIEAYFSCLYERSISGFEFKWKEMMTKWPAVEPYMHGELYPIRSKWASAWTEPYTAFGAHSTQRVEAMNNLVKQCVRPSHPLTDLFRCIIELSESQSQVLIDTLSQDKFTKPQFSGPVYASARRVLTKQAAALLHDEGAWRENYQVRRLRSKPRVCFLGDTSVNSGVHIWPQDVDSSSVDTSVDYSVHISTPHSYITQCIFMHIAQLIVWYLIQYIIQSLFHSV